jgi:hypothetical protein
VSVYTETNAARVLVELASVALAVYVVIWGFFSVGPQSMARSKSFEPSLHELVPSSSEIRQFGPTSHAFELLRCGPSCSSASAIIVYPGFVPIGSQ